mgnify:FL=1
MATTIRGSDNFDTAFAKSVAIIADVKGDTTAGGTFTQDAWQTRDLNTELDDPSDIITITSNQFTLQAGTYLVEWLAPAYATGQHTTRLQNITESTTAADGTSEYTNVSNAVGNSSSGAGIITLSSPSAFEIQHYCLVTKTGNGFGAATNVTGKNNVYTLVKIHKIGA